MVLLLRMGSGGSPTEWGPGFAARTSFQRLGDFILLE